MRKVFALAGGAMLLALFSGCDQLGIDTPEKVALRKGAEAKAIGAACRHAMRAIEDCYVLNPKAEKAAVFEGWREMDEYMRENKIEGVSPVMPRPAGGARSGGLTSQQGVPASGDADADGSASKKAASESGG